MNDITALYYTANRIADSFAAAIRASLLDALSHPAGGPRVPIVAVSQQPIDVNGFRFGDFQIVVGPIGASIYNCYRQILIGAHAATTPYVALCEDDTLYVPEHFTLRPSPDTFAYNEHRYVITRQLSADRRRREAFYYWRRRTQMAMCIAPRALLIETLEERFARWPNPIPDDEAKRAGWGEPGRYERRLGLTPRARQYVRTMCPCVTFNHTASLMGRRAVQASDLCATELPGWGSAQALWDEVHGE